VPITLIRSHTLLSLNGASLFVYLLSEILILRARCQSLSGGEQRDLTDNVGAPQQLKIFVYVRSSIAPGQIDHKNVISLLDCKTKLCVLPFGGGLVASVFAGTYMPWQTTIYSMRAVSTEELLASRERCVKVKADSVSARERVSFFPFSS
jgi:hypothetical protein